MSDKNLNSIYDTWKTHGKLIKDVITDYENGKVNMETAMQALRPYIAGLNMIRQYSKEMLAELNREQERRKMV